MIPAMVKNAIVLGFVQTAIELDFCDGAVSMACSSAKLTCSMRESLQRRLLRPWPLRERRFRGAGLAGTSRGHQAPTVPGNGPIFLRAHDEDVHGGVRPRDFLVRGRLRIFRGVEFQAEKLEIGASRVPHFR